MRWIIRVLRSFPLLNLILVMIGLFGLPFALNNVAALFSRPAQTGIAPLFTPQVQHWSRDIVRWSAVHDIDPNLMATIMQIESCGHPTVTSWAGAQGLFQVMPFHFDVGEEMLDPETNATRSANFIHECSTYANGDPGLVMACYNGGPSVIFRSFDTWATETKRYFIWGLGIYADARLNAGSSQSLSEWLQAGGANLCDQAAAALGIRG
jgi:soluble lytic murein transglycosylase-like protein